MRKVLLTTTARWGTVSYRKSGDFPGRAIILVHGAVGDSRLFRYQLRHFGTRCKTIALDLPGHGPSFNGTDHTLDDFIGAIEDVMKAENIPSCVLIGHSMGGGVCLEAYRRGLTGLAGMVLVSTSSVLPVSPVLVDILRRDDMDALAELIVGAVFSKKTDLLIGFAKKGLYEMSRTVIKNDVDICLRMDYAGMLGDIRVPVLAVANSGDMVISCEMTASLAGGIPGSRFVKFDDPGHVPFFENPGAFNAAVDAFLKDNSLIE
ncbi:MAG TPA: alpha/beta hydrolase [Spirochaetota bacterium]|nr:alpha/beta hydrolase [Spirochaetota bacterium]HOD14065.1 alpha/beta hydrolase [Spirochaetota bacterium]HPG52271.1 alpha/beta hydrolase [Spirochaetota bacterium]HPN12657.1 alpha/beta hydrolase [Spirochaetota bacterium]HQL82735.1 alpha/beta hydrolase [Spirochaetota bacterium]